MNISRRKKSELNLGVLFCCTVKTLVANDICYAGCISLYNPNFEEGSRILCLNAPNLANIEEKSDNLVEIFLQHCFHVSEKNDIFLFHNLYSFESFFIASLCCARENYQLHITARDNKIYNLQITDLSLGKKIFFIDSYLLTSMSLDDLTKTFKIKKRAIWENSIGLNDFNCLKTIKNLSDTCMNQSIILAEAFIEYRIFIKKTFGVDPLTCLSLSSVSLKIFRTKYYNDKDCPIEHLHGNKDQFVRNSYRGGVVDVYMPLLTNGYHYDVNSLYPFVMSQFDMPIGKGIFTSKINIEEFFGFVEAEIETPSYLHIPFLTYYDFQKGLISPIGKWSATYFSEELKYAQLLGYKITPKKGIKYERGNPFKSFVNDMYTLRLKYKDEPIENTIKLLMNSLYGRLGMKNNISRIKILDNNDKEIDLYHSLFDIIQHYELKNKTILKYIETPEIDKLNELLKSKTININQYESYLLTLEHSGRYLTTAVQIASAITSWARITMHKYKTLENTKIYYSDTDSIFTDQKISDHLVSDTDLGKLKLVGKITEAIFVAPKLYYVRYEHGNTVAKSKGINKSMITKNDIVNIYENENGIYCKAKSYFAKTFSKFQITQKTSPYFISGTLKKRNKKYDLNNKWIDTSPLYIFV